jgi:hypothetical protein
MVAPELAPDTHPTTVGPYEAPLSAPKLVPLAPAPTPYSGPRIAPPTSATGDPFIDPVLLTPSVAAPSSSPSSGYSYTQPSLTLQTPTSASDTSPTTLPTVTTWASKLPSHWYIYAAVVLAVVLLVAYRRSRG